MPIVLSARQSFPVTLPEHASLAVDERPTFRVRALSAREFFAALEVIDANRHGPAFAHHVLGVALVGWTGVRDDAGEVIPFRRDPEKGAGEQPYLDVLTWGQIDALSGIIFGASRVAPPEAGNSATPSA